MSITAWPVRVVALAALVLSGCQAAGTSPPSGGDPLADTGTPAAATSTTPSAASRPASAATTCTIPSRFAGKDLERLPLVRKQIALTFDGGSGAQGVRSILRTLTDQQVPATFFLTGDFVRSFPRKAARIGRLHLVGNHTDTHPDLTRLGTPQVTGQVLRAQTALLAATGQDPRRFFRFPFGARDTRTLTVVNGLCYVAFRWTVDTLGWKGTSSGMSAGRVVDRVLAAAGPGAIVLMHVGANPDDHSTLDADALPVLIRRLRLLGYSFVRLSAVMSAAP